MSKSGGGGSSTRPRTSSMYYTTPGPGQYNVTNYLCASAPAFSMTSRPKTAADGTTRSITPGVGSYDITKHEKKGGVTLKSRPAWKPESDTPGPASYRISPSIHDFSPKFTMAGRPNSGAPSMRLSSTPGPGSYKLDTTIGRGRTAILSSRYTIRTTPMTTPGPGAYTPNSYAAAQKPPSYSLSSRTPLPQVGSSSPGPGAYKVNFDSVLRVPPRYSMQGRPQTAAFMLPEPRRISSSPNESPIKHA